MKQEMNFKADARKSGFEEAERALQAARRNNDTTAKVSRRGLAQLEFALLQRSNMAWLIAPFSKGVPACHQANNS